MTDNLSDSGNVLLICLPYAGGNSFAYRNMGKTLDKFIQPLAIDLPGHGLLFNEPRLQTLDEMADFVLDTIEDKVYPARWAIFGHSMGGMLGYLVAQRSSRRLLPPPLHLFVSARRPGGVKPPFYWSDLSREEFLDRLTQIGGIPAEVRANEELMNLFEPILYNDVKALETHPHDDTSPVICPITVLIGRDDDIPEDHAYLWIKDTISPVNVLSFPGGHFFIFERMDEVGRLISDTLAKDIENHREYRRAQIDVMLPDSGGTL
ncbi:MAG: alpha/beta fold hydrolase [Candidatus Latescibacterota bacterium]